MADDPMPRSKPVPIVPVPDEAPECAWRHPKLGAPVARWPYHDTEGRLLGYAVRVEFVGEDGQRDKSVLPLTYCQSSGERCAWRARALPAPRPLYRLPELIANPSAPVIVTEGEKKADLVPSLFPSRVGTTSMGGAGAGKHSDWAPLAGRNVIVWPDHDEPGRRYAQDVAALATAAGAASVAIVAVPAEWPEGWDIADPLPEGAAPDTLARLLQSATPWTQAAAQNELSGQVDAAAEMARLAGLPLIEYGRERKASAQRLGCPVAILDKAVAAERGNGGSVAGQGRPLDLPDSDPWPESVDGAELLSAITNAVSRFMVMEKGMVECVALWALHTHALDAFGITPRLAITSPRPQCGKTTLLDILQRLVTRPLLAVSVSAASVFRVVEVARPTLLVDEADTFLPRNDELRGVLNSGHRRGGNVIRVVGDAMQVCQFSTFAPAAIAMIGRLPGTLADRSILIALKRKRADEQVKSFRHDRTQDLDRLARMCARWAADNIEQLRQADPAVPANLYNRAADNWRPLLAIADAVGDDWPGRAREIAAVTVHADQAKRAGLLADIREVFAERNTDRIKSEDLAAALVAMEGHPWAEHGKTGKPLSANSLARMLADDDILPKTVRFGVGQKDTHKGYMRAQFEDAFARYLAAPRIPTVTPSQPSDFCGSPVGSQPSQGDPVLRLEIGQNARVSAACDDVTVENQGAPKSTRVRMRL
jgi:hypothetical protein